MHLKHFIFQGAVQFANHLPPFTDPVQCPNTKHPVSILFCYIGIALYLQLLVETSVQKGHKAVVKKSWRRTVVELSPQCIYHTLIPIL